MGSKPANQQDTDGGQYLWKVIDGLLGEIRKVSLIAVCQLKSVSAESAMAGSFCSCE